MLEGGCQYVFYLHDATICLYTTILLKRCMDTDPNNIRTYPQIAFRAFGDKWRVLVSLLTYFELYLMITEFLIVVVDNLYNLFPKMCLHVLEKITGGLKSFVMLVTLVVLPTAWMNDLSFLEYFSTGEVYHPLHSSEWYSRLVNLEECTSIKIEF